MRATVAVVAALPVVLVSVIRLEAWAMEMGGADAHASQRDGRHDVRQSDLHQHTSLDDQTEALITKLLEKSFWESASFGELLHQAGGCLMSSLFGSSARLSSPWPTAFVADVFGPRERRC